MTTVGALWCLGRAAFRAVLMRPRRYVLYCTALYSTLLYSTLLQSCTTHSADRDDVLHMKENPSCLALECIAQLCFVLHYTTQHYTTLHYTTLHNTTLHYTTLHCTTLHCTTLHCTTLHCTVLTCLSSPILCACASQRGTVEGAEGAPSVQQPHLSSDRTPLRHVTRAHTL